MKASEFDPMLTIHKETRLPTPASHWSVPIVKLKADIEMCDLWHCDIDIEGTYLPTGPQDDW